jgi:membrane associated rhomboid family serine protease
MYNITPLVRNIIIINVVVFLAQMYLQNKYPLTEMIALSPIRSPYFKPFQFFTYMFAHGGFGHIFFNMLAFSYCYWYWCRINLWSSTLSFARR